MFTQEFFIEGKHYGSGPRKTHGRYLGDPRGTAFFCPKCGNLWAHCPVIGQEFDLCCRTYCSKCGKDDILGPAGSIWISTDDDYIKALPRAVLLREFELALRYQALLEQKHVEWGPRVD